MHRTLLSAFARTRLFNAGAGGSGAGGGAAIPAAAAAADSDEGGAGSIDDVGRAFLETLPPEHRERPFADPDAGDTDDLDDEQREPRPAEAATGEGEDDVVEILEREDGAQWNETAQRWTKDGKFVEGAAPEGWEPKAKPAGDTAADAPLAGDDAPKSTKITLSGLADRGEEDIELEVDDPDIATRIQRLKNDGMRRQAYDEQRAALDQQQARLAAYQQALETDPIGFHLQQMPRDEQLNVARALILEHFDDLLPDIEQFQQDPATRHQQRVDLRDRMSDTQRQAVQTRNLRDYATRVMRAAEGLVPENTDPARASRFVQAARIHLADAADRGVSISPESVRDVLAPLMQDYGFDAVAAAPAPRASADRPAAAPAAAAVATPLAGTVLAARPVSDRAREVASRVPSAAQASATQSRIRRVQAARAAGAKVVPPGAGAAPVQVPVVPTEAATDVASASKYLRQQGLPDTWAGMANR